MLAHFYSSKAKAYLDVTDMEGRTIILVDVKGKGEARKLCRIYNWMAWNF